METIAQLAMQRVLQMEGRKGSISIGQGSFIGSLNPTNMPSYKLMVLNLGDGLETRVLVSQEVMFLIEENLSSVEMIQYVGLSDNDLGIIVSYDIVIMTNDNEIIFQEG
jgi:hypothetical protein